MGSPILFVIPFLLRRALSRFYRLETVARQTQTALASGVSLWSWPSTGKGFTALRKWEEIASQKSQHKVSAGQESLIALNGNEGNQFAFWLINDQALFWRPFNSFQRSPPLVTFRPSFCLFASLTLAQSLKGYENFSDRACCFVFSFSPTSY